MNNCQSRPIEILLVEDSLSDAKVIAKAFERAAPTHCLRTVSNGVEAIAYLQKQGQYHTVPRPDIILLDLHLPKKDGLTVLQEIKSDQKFADIPIIMLTASDARKHIMECYQKEANCYLIKPNSLEEFKQTVQKIQAFWLQMVRLPMV